MGSDADPPPGGTAELLDTVGKLQALPAPLTKQGRSGLTGQGTWGRLGGGAGSVGPSAHGCSKPHSWLQ